MGLLDFLKNKLGSAGSGTVTTETENIYEGQPVAKIEETIVIKEDNIIPISSYIGLHAKAEMAKQLKDNPLLNAILDELKEFNLIQLLNTKEGEKEAREDLYRKVKTIDDIKNKIDGYIKKVESVKRREESRKDNYGVV